MNQAKHENGSGDGPGICRDFLRNLCHRGSMCKFKHPEDKNTPKEDLQFCHDFQINKCNRAHCKFIHGTKDDEEYYLRTGSLPFGFKENEAGRWMEGGDGEIPVCRDYVDGKCRRGNNCKFRHLSRGDIAHEERMRVSGAIGRPGPRQPLPPPPPIPGPYATEYEHERYRRWQHMSRMAARDQMTPSVPRQPMLPSEATEKGREMRELEEKNTTLQRKNVELEGENVKLHRKNGELEEENNVLNRKNDELRKMITNLTETNDKLLEQNTRLRAMRADATSEIHF